MASKKAAKNPHRLQNEFLSYLIKEQTPVTVFLLNGVRLQAVISAFDDFCISLSADGQVQAVYKQEISTISGGPGDLVGRPTPPRVRKPALKAIVARVRRITDAAAHPCDRRSRGGDRGDVSKVRPCRQRVTCGPQRRTFFRLVDG